MKKRELTRKLAGYGWYLLRQGGSHEVWTNGDHVITVPRHSEIKENTARMILREAAMNPGPKK